MKGRLPPTDGLQYNYCIDLRAFIKSFELNVAIINLRTGAHQLIFQSFELTVAIINLRTEHIYLFSRHLPQKGLIISMQVIKYTYLPAKSKSLLTESLSCSLYSL